MGHFPRAQEQPGFRRALWARRRPSLGPAGPAPAAQPRGGARGRSPGGTEALPVPGFRLRVPEEGPQIAGKLQPGPPRFSDSDHGLELVALAVLRLLEAGGAESWAGLPPPRRTARAARRYRRPRAGEAPRLAARRRGRGAYDSDAAE